MKIGLRDHNNNTNSWRKNFDESQLFAVKNDFHAQNSAPQAKKK